MHCSGCLSAFANLSQSKRLQVCRPRKPFRQRQTLAYAHHPRHSQRNAPRIGRHRETAHLKRHKFVKLYKVILYKGYGSTVVGLVPFIAVNFCAFDTLKSELQWTSTPGILGTGALAALVSQSICYPLDTVRRRMQIRGTPYKHGLDAFWQIICKEGFLRLYSGISANALKIVPNNSIRFLVYELCRQSLDI